MRSGPNATTICERRRAARGVVFQCTPAVRDHELAASPLWPLISPVRRGAHLAPSLPRPGTAMLGTCGCVRRPPSRQLKLSPRLSRALGDAAVFFSCVCLVLDRSRARDTARGGWRGAGAGSPLQLQRARALACDRGASRSEIRVASSGIRGRASCADLFEPGRHVSRWSEITAPRRVSSLRFTPRSRPGAGAGSQCARTAPIRSRSEYRVRHAMFESTRIYACAGPSRSADALRFIGMSWDITEQHPCGKPYPGRGGVRGLLRNTLRRQATPPGWSTARGHNTSYNQLFAVAVNMPPRIVAKPAHGGECSATWLNQLY